MKLRTIKKEISFLTGEIISNCYMALYFQGDKAEKPLADVIQSAVEAHNSMIERANHPVEKHNASLTRKHYAALRNDMIESADKHFSQISAICTKQVEGKSEWQRMIDGDPYHSSDPELVAGIARCRERLRHFNATGEGIDEVIAAHGERLTLVPPFSCDYGVNIVLGSDVFINCGCVFLDCGRITIGNHVFIGPGVKLCAATHPTHYLDRRDWEYTRPIVIEDDVWLGAGVVVCPGVTIGARSVAAAGSVITRDVPEDSLVGGNPAVIKKRLNGV